MHHKIDSIIQNQSFRYISFDVFDTVVTRKVGDPYAVFLLLGKRLYEKKMINSSPELFARARLSSEKRARRNNNYQEIQLRDIYEEMFLSHTLQDPIESFMEIEMEVERDQICAISGSNQMLDQIREKLGRVLFISDMYLPHYFLEEKLKSLHLFKQNDRLYLSSEFGLQKRHGLFDVVLKKECIKKSELFHFGDSLQHDVDPAKKIGIGVHQYLNSQLHPSEMVLNKHSFQTEAFSSLMSGAARRARLRAKELKQDEKVMWDTGASVTGPLVLLYALWIIDRARQQGIRNLCFLARDAYLPYRIVQKLLEVDPEKKAYFNISYIYGSRVTYNVLNVKKLGPDEWNKLATHNGYSYATIDDIRKALFCSSDIFDHHLSDLGYTRTDFERNLEKREVEKIRNHILTDVDFNRAILKCIYDQQDHVLQQFKKNITDSDEGVALIDAGWSTKSHAPLYNFLKEMGCENLRMFYIGLVTEKPDIPVDSVDTFIFNKAKNQGILRKNIKFARPVESLLITDHGRTYAFRKEGDDIVPLLEDVENPEFINRYFEHYKKGIFAFINEIMPSVAAYSALHSHRDIAEDLIFRFWKNPTDGEALVWSKLFWEWDPMGKIKYPLAKPYQYKDIWKAFFQGRLPQLYDQFWRAGAKKLTSKPVIISIDLSFKARKLFVKGIRFMPKFIRRPFAIVGKEYSK